MRSYLLRRALGIKPKPPPRYRLLVVMATLIQFSGGTPGGIYHPPVIEDGVIKPGEID